MDNHLPGEIHGMLRAGCPEWRCVQGGLKTLFTVGISSLCWLLDEKAAGAGTCGSKFIMSGL